MNNTITVFHMQGLGDHISYSALIRRLLIKHNADEIFVMCWAHYAQTVAFMYRDDIRIKIVPITSGRELVESRHAVSQLNSKYIYIFGPDRGIWDDLFHKETQLNQLTVNESLEKYPWGHRNYYDFSGIDWKYRFTETLLARSLEHENMVFNKLNPNHEEYVFVQDDPYRNHHMNMDLVKDLVGKDVKVIRNDPSEMLFFYPMILQNAKQIHIMESSFRCLLETIPTEGVEFFLHHYIRKTDRLVYDSKICPVETRKPWIVIE